MWRDCGRCRLLGPLQGEGVRSGCDTQRRAAIVRLPYGGRLPLRRGMAPMQIDGHESGLTRGRKESVMIRVETKLLGNTGNDEVNTTAGKYTLRCSMPSPIGLGTIPAAREEISPETRRGTHHGSHFPKYSARSRRGGWLPHIGHTGSCVWRRPTRAAHMKSSLFDKTFLCLVLGACGRCPVDLQWYMY